MDLFFLQKSAFWNITLPFLIFCCNLPVYPKCFREYTSDILRLANEVSRRDALRAGAEVVKQVCIYRGLIYGYLKAGIYFF